MAEVLIASGMAGALALGLAQLTKNTNEDIKVAQSKSDSLAMNGKISSLIANPDACNNSFAAISTAGNLAALSSSAGFEVTELRDKNAAVVITSCGTTPVDGCKLGNAWVNSMVVKDLNTAADTAMLRLIMNYKKGTKVLQAKPIDIPLEYDYDTGANSLTSCFGSGGSGGGVASVWEAMSSGIYYNGGSVMVGPLTNTVDTSNDITTPGFASGASNTVTGGNGAAFGSGNTVSGAQSFAAGASNSASAAQVFLAGNGNTSNMANSFALGLNNSIGGWGSAMWAIGNQNTAYGNNQMAIGVQNRVEAGGGSMALGWNNYIQATPGSSYAIGSNNNINIASGTGFGTAIGNYLRITASGAMSLGDNSAGAVTTNSTANSFKGRFLGGYTFHNDAAQTVRKTVMFEGNTGEVAIGHSTPLSPLHIVRTGVAADDMDGSNVKAAMRVDYTPYDDAANRWQAAINIGAIVNNTIGDTTASLLANSSTTYSSRNLASSGTINYLANGANSAAYGVAANATIGTANATNHIAYGLVGAGIASTPITTWGAGQLRGLHASLNGVINANPTAGNAAAIYAEDVTTGTNGNSALTAGNNTYAGYFNGKVRITKQDAWTTISPPGTHTSPGGQYAPWSYRLNSLNHVSLRGLWLSNTASYTATAVTTLPSAYRPTYTVSVPANCYSSISGNIVKCRLVIGGTSSAAPGQIDILGDAAGDATYVSIDNITFPLD